MFLWICFCQIIFHFKKSFYLLKSFIWKLSVWRKNAPFGILCRRATLMKPVLGLKYFLSMCLSWITHNLLSPSFPMFSATQTYLCFLKLPLCFLLGDYEAVNYILNSTHTLSTVTSACHLLPSITSKLQSFLVTQHPQLLYLCSKDYPSHARVPMELQVRWIKI